MAMKTRTLVLVGLGVGAVIYGLTRRTPAAKRTKKPKGFSVVIADDFQFPVPPPPSTTEPLAACATGEFSHDDVLVIHDTVDKTLPLFAGPWKTIPEAQDQAHLVANYVMASLCPTWPIAKARHNVPSYEESYGEGWSELYNTAFITAFNTITQS
jgi:hypothetical protein